MLMQYDNTAVVEDLKKRIEELEIELGLREKPKKKRSRKKNG